MYLVPWWFICRSRKIYLKNVTPQNKCLLVVPFAYQLAPAGKSIIKHHPDDYFGSGGCKNNMKRQNVRTLSLVVCTFTYLLIGAAVFDALESKHESKRDDLLKASSFTLRKKYNISDDDYRMIELVITEYKPHKAGPQWKFAGAFYFATVVLAMIGYGHSTPVTAGGKAFCMGYAMVGIPLGLVMFQSIGERLNKFASVVIRQIKKYMNCSKVEATEMNLMFATGMLSSIIITTGAAVFSRYEGWTYFDSFYYCFVTLTTIGFGDYVALQNDNALKEKPGYVALSLVFILFGLAVVAASINLLVLRFMTMNAEDIRRDEQELQSFTHNVLTLEDEVMGVDEKLLTGQHTYTSNNEYDPPSVCSCNCLSLKHGDHEYLLDYSYRPSQTFLGGNLNTKRASV